LLVESLSGKIVLFFGEVWRFFHWVSNVIELISFLFKVLKVLFGFSLFPFDGIDLLLEIFS
jgi:hypothetical protein